MSAQSPAKISIIIPVLNEEDSIGKCLDSLPSGPDVEVIVSDGGSTDKSVELAKKSDTTVIDSPMGRAQQMNAGAKVATGDVLLFLHADTQLPGDAANSIRQAISEGFSMGCFERVFDSDHPLLKWTSRWAGWRARKFFVVYGDQAIFIRRDLFEQLGGYRELKRFEDVDLGLRAKKKGRWTVLPGPIMTDARRFGASPLKRVLKDAWLTIAWMTGIIRE